MILHDHQHGENKVTMATMGEGTLTYGTGISIDEKDTHPVQILFTDQRDNPQPLKTENWFGPTSDSMDTLGLVLGFSSREALQQFINMCSQALPYFDDIPGWRERLRQEAANFGLDEDNKK